MLFGSSAPETKLFLTTKRVWVARLSGKVSSCTVETIEKRGFTGFRFDGSFPRTRLSNVVKQRSGLSGATL
jgi:hypothetical protein